MYRRIKKEPVPEIYVAAKKSVGVRRVIAGLRLGCLPLAVELGRYTGTPYLHREGLWAVWPGVGGGPTSLFIQLPLTITYQTETIHAL